HGQTRHGAYCTTLNGQQHVLAAGPDDATTGPNYLAALDAYRELLELDHAGTAKDRNPCRVVCELYLRDLQTRASPGTMRIREQAFEEFAKSRVIDLPIRELTPFAVKDWINQMREERTVTYTNHKSQKQFHRKFRWGNGKVRF